MTNLSNAQSLHAVSDEAWAEAVRREAVIRPLAAAPRLSKAAIGVAARALGLSAPRVYGLLRAFRRQPVTASLLPTKPGPMKGTRRLAGAIEAKIDAAIEAVYLKPERPTLRRTLREVRQDCRDAGLTPPSIKALRARVSARSLRERAAARDGTETAGNQFHQVHGGLRTGRPLQIVQIDHTKVDIMLVDDITRACIGRPSTTGGSFTRGPSRADASSTVFGSRIDPPATPRFGGHIAEVAEASMPATLPESRRKGRGVRSGDPPRAAEALSRSRGAFLAMLGRIYRDLRARTGP